MALNLAELQQKADRVIHNADEFVRRWIEFISAPAGNVTLEYYDQNGNLQTVSFSNRNKLVQDFIANVNSVMVKTFYVDAVNGDDGNDGSQSAPFRTLKKAIDSVPSGGRGSIFLLSDYDLGNEGINITNCLVSIQGASVNPDGSPIYTLRNSSTGRGKIIVGSNACLHLDNIKLECNQANDVPHWATLLKVGIGYQATVVIGHWVDLTVSAYPVEIYLNYPMLDVEASIVDLVMVATKITAPSVQSLVSYVANGKTIYTGISILDVNSNVTLPALGIS